MIWEGEHCSDCEALRHDLERYMTIANEHVNEVEVLKKELSDFRQEVSDIVYNYIHVDGGPDDWGKLETLINTKPPTPPIVEIHGSDGRVLLSIHTNGTVEGEIEDASEAARVFVEHLRHILPSPKTVTVPVVSAYARNDKSK